MTTLPREPVPQSDLAAAYRAATEREVRRTQEGVSVVGYKIGYTNMRVWNDLGITAPMWGVMYDDSVIDAGDHPFRYDASALRGPRIEPEIVVHFFKSPAIGATMEELLDCVDWVAPGFEIVISLPDGKPATVTQAITNGGMHGALLVGARLPVGELGSQAVRTLGDIRVELRCDGELKEAGSSANVLDHPLAAIIQLMEGLQREGMAPIKAGDTVTTGTMTAAYDVMPGQCWTATLAGAPLAGLNVTFE